MTDDGEAAAPDRDALDRQVRDRYGTWRDRPRGLACAVVAAFLVLTTIGFAAGIAALVIAAT
ncbi:hypothetical protein AB0L25_01670 [Spirillospora sp. NPDC052242]